MLIVCGELQLTLLKIESNICDVEAEALQLRWVLLQNISDWNWYFLEHFLGLLELDIYH
jgi:hypothetical protein